jgi:hypothetical protein
MAGKKLTEAEVRARMKGASPASKKQFETQAAQAKKTRSDTPARKTTPAVDTGRKGTKRSPAEYTSGKTFDAIQKKAMKESGI